MPIHFLALAEWTHPSWLPRGKAARTERARAKATVDLLDCHPQLLDIGTVCAPRFAMALSRPALGRVLRVCAALSCAHSLCLVVSGAARAQFRRDSGLSLLSAVQSHARAVERDTRLGAPLDCFDRHQLTAAGLAIALAATSDAAQRLWLQLRVPVQWVSAAQRFCPDGLPAHDALELLDDALALAGEEQRP